MLYIYVEYAYTFFESDIKKFLIIFRYKITCNIIVN